MKNIIFLFAMAALFFTSCEEIAPNVTGSMGEPIDTSINVDDQQRQVLIEEFTGVRCVNCPAGSAAIEDMLAANAPNLIAVSIHAGEFAPPYSQSQYDFRTPEGEAILSYIAEPFGFPTASVNRRLFSGQFDRQLGQGEWAGYVAEEKAIPPKIKIAIEPEFNATSRLLDVKVTLFIQENITAPDVRLSIMLTESNIVDLQLTPASQTPKADYKHKHVLRGMMTNYDGAPISESLVAGAEIVKSFSYTLPAEWKEGDCDIIAFVSLAGQELDILQAHKVEVIE